MDSASKLKFTREVVKSHLAEARGKFLVEMENKNYVNAQFQYDVISGDIGKLENLSERIFETLEDESEMKSELEEQNSLLETKCEVANLARNINVERDYPTSDDKDYKGGVRIKLPILRIPKFTGKYEDWAGWFEMYSNAVHNNDRLSGIDKFNYLRTFLGGDAKKTVEGIKMSNDNYKIAIDLLVKRFNKPRLIIKALLSNIIPKVECAHDYDSLKILYQKFEISSRLLNNFKDLGINSESLGLCFSVMLQWQLPDYLVIEYERKFTSIDMPTLQQSLEFLESEIAHQENLPVHKQQQSDSSQQPHFNRFKNG